MIIQLYFAPSLESVSSVIAVCSMHIVQPAFRLSRLSLRDAQLPLVHRCSRRHPSMAVHRVGLTHVARVSSLSTFTDRAWHRVQETSIAHFASNNTARATHRSRILRSFPSSPTARPSNTRPNLDSDGPPRQVIFWGILVLNGIIYVAWQRAYYEYVRKAICVSLIYGLIRQWYAEAESRP